MALVLGHQAFNSRHQSDMVRVVIVALCKLVHNAVVDVLLFYVVGSSVLSLRELGGPTQEQRL